MKKIFILTLIAISFQFTSCKTETKKKAKELEKVMPFSIKNAKNTIGWTAYKTTKKIGVKGQFNKINITANGEGNSVKEAINGVEFSIPVSSIFTKDQSRDLKIQKFFFGIMKNTSLLSGKLILNDNTSGTAEITMNGIAQKFPFEYKIEGKIFSMISTIDINKWNGQSAITSLNNACKDLHKGADGVSKTWNDVALNITSIF